MIIHKHIQIIFKNQIKFEICFSFLSWTKWKYQNAVKYQTKDNKTVHSRFGKDYNQN